MADPAEGLPFPEEPLATVLTKTMLEPLTAARAQALADRVVQDGKVVVALAAHVYLEEGGMAVGTVKKRATPWLEKVKALLISARISAVQADAVVKSLTAAGHVANFLATLAQMVLDHDGATIAPETPDPPPKQAATNAGTGAGATGAGSGAAGSGVGGAAGVNTAGGASSTFDAWLATAPPGAFDMMMEQAQMQAGPAGKRQQTAPAGAAGGETLALRGSGSAHGLASAEDLGTYYADDLRGPRHRNRRSHPAHHQRAGQGRRRRDPVAEVGPRDGRGGHQLFLRAPRTGRNGGVGQRVYGILVVDQWLHCVCAAMPLARL
jgi:hypothetical protein